MPEQCLIKSDKECHDCLGDIKRSLIYAMSRGSHELFHTNIWAWLIERDHSFIGAFFNALNGNFLRVDRESGNRDLTIWLNEQGKELAYVVENKFKSVPRESQLEDYTFDLRKKEQFGKGLLVSLATPPGGEKWEWETLTQTELMKRIEERIKSSTAFSELEKKMVVSYAAMTRKLSAILAYYSDLYRSQWPMSGAGQVLEDVKLWNIFAKMKSAEFAQYIEKQTETAEWRKIAKQNGLFLIVRPGFSNKSKSALLDVRLEKHRQDYKGHDEEPFSIGIQIQGNQYRRCVCSHDVARFKSAEVLYRQFCKDGIWLGDCEFLEMNTTMEKEFCKYEPKDYRFVYQYMILEDGCFAKIFERLRLDMNKLVGLLENSKERSIWGEERDARAFVHKIQQNGLLSTKAC